MTVRRKSAVGACAAALAFALPSAAVLAQAAPAATAAPTREAEIAREAYSYLYPLVVMDVTRRQATQKGATGMGAPVNTFHHNQAFPPGDFRAVVRPNFDTLYSSAWLDLADGPILLTIGTRRGGTTCYRSTTCGPIPSRCRAARRWHRKAAGLP
ncbi:DUF1254 domain-containing protein [Novosphingobium sp. NBM11]|uniref:DUF1254 domain-containing protein n=1 Tax=Novosphingobium sp. NBM11 TaxID=2596914 RepID=UPI0019D5964B|nr:DUF1254 domain-containing protein [Novosphingobium sp. NBM11]